jgi:ribitol 2-dehydrogenase
MSNLLAGKIAVVTGASKGGIGHACALALLQAGAFVVPIARNVEKLKETYDEYRDFVIPIAADLLKKEERETLVERILGKIDHIDIFLANAGMYVGGDVAENSIGQIEDALTLNILGVITPVRAVLPHMIGRKTGDIIVTGSIAGDGYNPYFESVYGSSKTAVEQFVKLTRNQVSRHGIRLSAISPGPTKTPLVSGWDPKRLKNAIAHEEFISPKEVADAFMYGLTLPRHIAIPRMVITPKAFNLL